MNQPAGSVSARRVRWAERENRKRQQVHAAALGRWRADDAELRAMIAAARSPRAVALPEVWPPVELRRGETPLWASVRVRMVEPEVSVPLGVPGHRDFSLGTVRGGQDPGVAPHRVRDQGTVIVTDRRVLFRGQRGNREWAYAKITGLRHDLRWPCTLIHVTNRQKTSGLLLDPGEVSGFRFACTLGIAEHAGQRDGFVAHLEHLLGAHQNVLPPAPPIARPEEARRSARLPVAGAVAGVAGLFLLVGLVSPDQQPEGQKATSAVQSTTPAPRTSTKPASPAPTASATPTKKPPVIARPTRRVPKKTRKPQATPKPKQLCGAPDNPLGYNFCGGALIYDPALDACSYFDCIDNFDNGKGYMIQCRDGTYSLSGGRRGACSYHDGVRRPVHR